MTPRGTEATGGIKEGQARVMGSPPRPLPTPTRASEINVLLPQHSTKQTQDPGTEGRARNTSRAKGAFPRMLALVQDVECPPLVALLGEASPHLLFHIFMQAEEDPTACEAIIQEQIAPGPRPRF